MPGFSCLQLDPELRPPVPRSKDTKSLPYSSGSIFVVPKTVTFVPLMAGGERDVPITPSSPSTLTWCSLAWILENFTRERLPGLWPCLVSGHRVPPPLSRAVSRCFIIQGRGFSLCWSLWLSPVQEHGNLLLVPGELAQEKVPGLDVGGDTSDTRNSSRCEREGLFAVAGYAACSPYLGHPQASCHLPRSVGKPGRAWNRNCPG